jgi:small-conductance mechanosensitive channel
MTEWIDILAGNAANAWFTAGGIFISLMALVVIARYVATKYLSVLASRTSTRLDDIVLLVVKAINIIIVFVIAVFLAHKPLITPEKLTQMLRIAAISAVFLQVALWGNAIINFYLKEVSQRAGKQAVNISARRAMAFLSRLVLWLLVLTLLLENLGVRLTPLLAGIGIGGVAIALALQNILSDLFCYVAIIFDKPFISGDFLIIDDLMGSVERIGLKTTRIRSLSGELLIFANHDLINSRIRNYKTLQERRIVMKFGVTYETPVEKLRKIPQLVRDVFASVSEARLDRVHFAQLGNFSLDFEAAYFVLTGDYTTYMNVQQEVNLSLMEQFGKEGIDFAYPTQTLYINKVRQAGIEPVA